MLEGNISETLKKQSWVTLFEFFVIPNRNLLVNTKNIVLLVCKNKALTPRRGVTQDDVS